MAEQVGDLIEWAKEQRKEALRQIDLFSGGGVKAQLVMQDGTTQDITAAVLSHQKANVDAFTRLVSALKS
jgi:triosephosphate isomerase